MNAAIGPTDDASMSNKLSLERFACTFHHLMDGMLVLHY